jgi:Holliday junction resolvasome RuvABC endonuclease subunit
MYALPVVGFDPSLRNWGIASGVLSPTGLKLHQISVTQPILSKSKQVRQNSLDLDSAQQLCLAALKAAKGARAIFVEVPVGSQSARAMASYGICVGILGALRSTGVMFFEVTPTEVKLASVGSKVATKQQMIAWAMAKHPEANWPTYMEHGKVVVSEAKAEHMADAVGSIYAGIACNQFQQMLPLMFDRGGLD